MEDKIKSLTYLVMRRRDAREPASAETGTIDALIAERESVEVATEYAATLRAENEWRRLIEIWVSDGAQYLVVVNLPDQTLVCMPDDLADVQSVFDISRAHDEGAPFQLKLICSHATAAALVDAIGFEPVNGKKPRTLH